MKNYICIDGNKAELTREQLIALGIKIENGSPFELKEGKYFFLNSTGVDEDFYSSGCIFTKNRHNVANYCTDKSLMEQRALYETLSRLLWRYSMEHKGERVDKKVWTIHKHDGGLRTGWVSEKVYSFGECIFDTLDIAEAALKEVVEPFMKAHPDFKF